MKRAANSCPEKTQQSSDGKPLSNRVSINTLKVIRHAVSQKALILSLVNDKKLIVSPTSPTYPQESIIRDSFTGIISLFSQLNVSPHRLIYIAAGFMFQPQSALPYGGSKRNPGYLEYTGRDVDSLLWFLVSAAFKWYWRYRGREGIDFLTHSMNHTLLLHGNGEKDFLDEMVMKGMMKAGHLERSKSTVIPENLRFVREKMDGNEFVSTNGVQFTPGRRKILLDRGCGEPDD
ncbi:hypothetical protein BJ741DRAFT_163524 [Chytriomyces cf. hyalinus JEL632]|nr:hypothetical protein BJ741DRAFT_163524 [Chytriomyces cf. hyalinus JEL632]